MSIEPLTGLSVGRGLSRGAGLGHDDRRLLLHAVLAGRGRAVPLLLVATLLRHHSLAHSLARSALWTCSDATLGNSVRWVKLLKRVLETDRQTDITIQGD